MTTKEIFYYVKLMCLIKNKNKGKADENDVQRALGSLYIAWEESKNDR